MARQQNFAESNNGNVFMVRGMLIMQLSPQIRQECQSIISDGWG